MEKKDAIKYVLILACIMCGVLCVIFSPDLYKLTHLHLGPASAFGFVCGGTLIWDSVSD